MKKFIEAGAVKNRILLSLLLTIPFIFLGEVLYLPAFLVFNYMVAEDYESQLIDMRLLSLLAIYIIGVEICVGPTTDKRFFKYVLTPLSMWMFLQGIRNFTATIIDSLRKTDEEKPQAVPDDIELTNNTDDLKNDEVTMPFLPAFYAGLLTVLIINEFWSGITSNMYNMLSLLGFLEFLSIAIWILGYVRMFLLKLKLTPVQEIHYQIGDGDVYVIPVLSMIISSLINTYFILWLAAVYIVIGYAIRKYILKRGKA